MTIAFQVPDIVRDFLDIEAGVDADDLDGSEEDEEGLGALI